MISLKEQYTLENHMKSHNNVEILMPVKLKKRQKRLFSHISSMATYRIHF